MKAIDEGADVDEAIKELDDAELSKDGQMKLAMEDFRREISFLKSLRHP